MRTISIDGENVIVSNTAPIPIDGRGCSMDSKWKRFWSDLKPGEHFDCDRKFLRRAKLGASPFGFRLAQKKIGPDAYRVWRR